jgi:signal peptidase II
VKRSFPLLVGIAGLVLWADQWTKSWAENVLIARPPVNVIGELVRFTYTRNSGVAFGLGAGHRFPFYLFSVAAVGVILVMFARHRAHSLIRQLALALILGGALGNLVDRLTTGEVIDFILIGFRQWYWPVFNVADSAVTIGVLMFALTWLRHSEHTALAEAAPDDHAPAVVGPGAEQRGAAGPLPGRGADGPVA